jgi:esterase/lipase superfamily enzyme
MFMNARAHVSCLLLAFATVVSVVAQSPCERLSTSSDTAAASKANELKTRLKDTDLSAEAAASSPAVQQEQNEFVLATLEDSCASGASDTVRWGTPAEVVSVPVLFATDRDGSSSGGYRGVLRTGAPIFGSATITVKAQGVRTDFIYGTKRVAASTLSGKPSQTAELSEEGFEKSLNNSTESGGHSKPILLFVHGYNVTFEDAITSGARLALGMRLPITPVVYTWASAGSALSYLHDEDTVRVSTLSFTTFLYRLLTTQKRPVIIVAHSMGARIVTGALAELSRRNCACKALAKVVLAAPDLNVLELSAQWSALQQFGNIKWTIYASSNDIALILSHIIHHYQRVGDPRPSLFISKGSDTVDASATSSALDSWGHSYVIGNPMVAADIGSWVAKDLLPSARGLNQEFQGNSVYYVFP